jgi:hypothetical protein
LKKTALALMALAFFGLLPAAHDRNYDIREKESIQKTLNVADASQAAEVIVDNVWGSVRVEGAPGRDVILTAQKTILAESKEKLRKAKEEVKLDITEKGNTVDIYVDGPFRCHDHSSSRRSRGDKDPGYIVQYDFVLKVPFRTKLDVSTVNEGDVEVKNVEGDFEVENVNGEVRIFEINGSGKARTVNGEVRVVFNRPPAGKCSFGSVNGDLTISFPADLSADFRIKTFNGEVYSDFPVTYLPAAPAVREQTKGKYVFKSDRFFGVRTGKGGPEIKMDTLNGDILIKKRTV